MGEEAAAAAAAARAKPTYYPEARRGEVRAKSLACQFCQFAILMQHHNITYLNNAPQWHIAFLLLPRAAASVAAAAALHAQAQHLQLYLYLYLCVAARLLRRLLRCQWQRRLQ